MEYIYNPIYNKYPSGAVIKGTCIEYTLQISKTIQFQNLSMIIIDDKTGSEKTIRMPLLSVDANHYTHQVKIPFEAPGLYWYYFKVDGTFLCKNSNFDIEPTDKLSSSFAQFVYEKQSKVDKSHMEGITYHIFVDRFKKSGKVTAKDGIILRDDWGGEITKNSKDFLVINQECFGGNLQGIIDKLPYIKSLGTKTIYLSPIFESFSYHKYDTADYEHVDTMFGGDETFEKLVTTAKQHGINILLDGVFSHVGSDSIYFNKLGRYNTVGAYQSEESKYFNWFKFKNHPNEYAKWWGIDTLPQFDDTNATLQKFISGPNGVISKHMKSGILGFRLDVVDETSDLYLNGICERIKKENPNGLIIGEVWEDAATKIAYGRRRNYFSGTQLDSVMNYPLKNAIIDYVLNGNAENLASTLYMLKDHYPPCALNTAMNFLGTHDTKRILSVLIENKKNLNTATSLLKIASAIQYISPGIPTVFYGDEIGIQGGDAPFCRVCFPWGSEDKEILEWYRNLGKLRSDSVFSNGDCNILFAHNGVFVFERKADNKRIIFASNCNNEDFKLNLTGPMKDFPSNEIIKDYKMLKPNEFVILKGEYK